ncbi:MAG: RNA polymerase factor sigma-54 [Cereibacter sp.]
MTRQRIGLTQTQRLQLTPGLQQSIRLLRMDAGGLTRFLEEQAARNPFLAVEEPPVLPATWLPRWGAAFAACRCSESGRSDPAMPAPSLMAHVLTQIRALACAPAERQIALVLAEALDPSGWLGRPLADLARQANCSVAQAEAVLMRLQRIEPTGLFARSLAECLRLQAQEADRLDPVMQRVLENLEMVASGQIGALARLCAVPESDVMARLRVIRSFNPKPGAQFDPVNSDTHEPDLIVTEGAQGWDVQLNRTALPALSVRRPQGRLTAQAERAALAEALGLCRIVERRNTTLLRVAHEVLQRQTAALDRGLAGLRPMTLADVAGALNLHESTVSRLVAGVSIATPQGTWQLRALFGPQVGDLSAAAIRAEIAQLVAAEDPARPLTDRAITEALLASGREVARRTVAKYRDMLRIPPAGSRRRLRRR